MLRARVLPAGQYQDIRIGNHYIFDSAIDKQSKGWSLI
jgi:hypothetical protein